MLNIIVLVKQVPDTESLLEVDPQNARVNTDNVKWVVNPYDEFAVEEALQIKERLGGGKVTVLTAGPKRSQAALRTALAMGADEAVMVDDPAVEGSGPLGTARAIAAAVKTVPFDLIIAGMRAVDDDAYQVPAAVAEALGLPLTTCVTKATVGEGNIVCQQAVEGGVLEIETDLPAIFTTQKGINLPRYASLPAVMKAKKKPLKCMTLGDLDVDADRVGPSANRVSIVSVARPPERSGGILIEGDGAAGKAAELVRRLVEEAEVL